MNRKWAQTPAFSSQWFLLAPRRAERSVVWSVNSP